MSEITGWYYLHENKQLIYKNDEFAISDIRESDLCLSAWPWTNQRPQAWGILVEGLALGANVDRITELLLLWKCDDADAVNYAEYVGCVLGQDGDKKTAYAGDFINLQESPCGFGNTYLEAMADLCKQLGYKGGKMWNPTFETIMKEHKK